ncbi:hypothetical protein [Streptomyces luteireticuli]|uniref:hypothetical protein n=1 Tax=Streptomyces luteireticuli TaxID=173858 RepID=UPI0035563A8A
MKQVTATTLPPSLAALPGTWSSTCAPMNPQDAYTLACPPGIARAFAAAHAIEPWLGRRLIRPMLADLAATGAWAYNDRVDMYLLHDAAGDGERLCHAVLLTRTGRALQHYATAHPDADCPSPAPPAPAGESCLADLHSPALPPRGMASPWRHVLRTSAALPVNLSATALRAVARVETGNNQVTDTSVVPAYLAAAAIIRGRFTGLVPDHPGHYHLHDGSGITLGLVCDLDHKPLVTHWRYDAGQPKARAAHSTPRAGHGDRSRRARPATSTRARHPQWGGPRHA